MGQPAKDGYRITVVGEDGLWNVQRRRLLKNAEGCMAWHIRRGFKVIVEALPSRRCVLWEHTNSVKSA